jgi:membrane-associated phospholipid phosphatase
MRWHPRMQSRALVLVCGLGVLCLTPQASAQAPATEPDRFSFGELLLRDARAPFTRSGAAFLAAGATLSLAALPGEQPQRMQSSLDASAIDGLLDFGDGLGAGQSVASLAALSWLGGSMAQRPGLAEFGRDLSSAFLVTSAYTWTLKASIDRQRPNGGAYSFPSGHTAAAFAAASVLDRHTGALPSLAGYLLASATAAGRMEENRHYLSDVVFGASLGMTIGGAPLARTPFAWMREHVAIGRRGLGIKGTF